MKLNEKVRAVREAKGLTRKDFADSLHVSESWIGQVENGKKVPGDALLDLMMFRYNVSVDWWEAGEGEMFDTTKKLPLDTRRELAHAEFDRIYDDFTDDGQQMELVSELLAFLAKKRREKN